ncbi:MAG: aminotransferase class I/II-fold pyridoxal phosphate-dependent enzyme [Phycisphaeraceae bacterium]|nr:MAG: aminotransferase class I/II-fold pyridoxal phosphate-dependent enzyme [Phycisphaeraceae bacterium]
MPGEPIRQNNATYVRINGIDAACFAGCNYLGLAHDPRVLDAARSAAGRVGVSTSASRATSGNTDDHAGLEVEVAVFVSRDRFPGLLLPDGYTANLAAAQGLAENHRCAVLDERAHRSLFDAARLAGLPIVTYPHKRADLAAELLADLDVPAAVMTDGVFTAHGAVAPLRGLADALRPGDTLLVDDCHGFCVLGEGGRGTCDELGLDLESGRIVITTTLAKGLGCGGGVVIGPNRFIDGVQANSTAYICTTPVSPIIAAAGREALRIVKAEPDRVARLRDNTTLLREVCDQPTDRTGDPPTPIVAITPPSPGSRLARTLLDGGLYVPLMTYPGGPSAEYLRISVTSEHSEEQIRRLGHALAPAALGDAAACLKT